MTKELTREQFEKWISSPPFEKDLSRDGENQAWPGAYRDYAVHLAWDAWKQARAQDQAEAGLVERLRAFVASQTDLQPEFRKALDEHFWELLQPSPRATAELTDKDIAGGVEFIMGPRDDEGTRAGRHPDSPYPSATAEQAGPNEVEEMVLVPREPTGVMLEAGEAIDKKFSVWGGASVGTIYRTMLEAQQKEGK